MSENKAVFLKYRGIYVLMHIKNNRAENIYAYDSLDKIDIGTIINCRAEEHAAGIDATFVRYSKDGMGFINKYIKGQIVMPLMYKKDARDEKKACFTDKISINGDYVVVIPGEPFVKVSAGISHENAEKYRNHFMPVAQKTNCGLIIRTKTETSEDGIIKADSETKKICAIFDSVKEKSMHTPAYTVLYRPIPGFINDLLYLIETGIEEIVTDDTDIKDVLERSYDTVAGDPVNVTDRVGLRFYDDKLLPLCNLYSFNAKISEALSRKVYLKSGAYITFDKTEALTAVDVNSSSCSYKNAKDDTFLRVNIEAAAEICRQMRIRNLSGMIVVDFINMNNSSDYDLLMEKIKDFLRSDRISSRFIDFTGLGLCEITRKRAGSTLYEILGERK